MKTKFISYLRVSTDRQGKSGLGLEAQRANVFGYLVNEHSELLEEFVEIESGKGDVNRPQLQAALHLCKITGAKLVIAKLDRLSRDAHFLLGLQKAGVPFVCADMPEANELTVGIMALVAEQERKMISKRTKEALAIAKARGVKLGNPNGAEHLKGLGNKAAVKAIKSKAQEYAEDLRHIVLDEIKEKQGITSANGIANELNKRSITTPRGGKWYAKSVSRLLERLA